MTGITALHLARAQFAFTISFHFIFPAFSIGLASYLTVLEALWLKTGKQVPWASCRPDVIPGSLSIWGAAAPPSSQIFMLVGACVLIPGNRALT